MRSDRTLFYPLPLEGLGTGQVESLSSYVTRLAFAHQLKPQTVLEMVLKNEPLSGLTTKASHLCSNWDISSTGSVSQQIVARFERQTGQVLWSSSLARFSHIFSSTSFVLPRRQERVCLHCVRESGPSGLPFGRLLWWVQAVVACPIHKIRLVQSSQCNAPPHELLSALQRPKHAGVCRRCGSIGHTCISAESGKATDVEVWIAGQVAEMLAMPDELVQRLGVESLRQGLRAIVDDRFGGKVVPTSLSSGLARATLSGWLNGQFKPSLPGVIQVCLLAKCQLSGAVAGMAVPVDGPPSTSKVERCVRREYVRLTQGADAVRDGLVKAAASEAPPSVQQHCEAQGISHYVVRKRFPMEAKALAEAHRALLAREYKKRLDDTEQVLEVAAQRLKNEGQPINRRTLQQASGMTVFSHSIVRSTALKSVLDRHAS